MLLIKLVFFIFQDIKFNSQFTGEFFEIEATDFFLEPDARLECIGRGTTEKTPGAGLDSAQGGSGAGHATEGGRSAVDGGGTYGSLYRPVETGSSGGKGPHGLPGSRGGGKVRVWVGFALTLDGIINVDAENAAANSGNSAK